MGGSRKAHADLSSPSPAQLYRMIIDKLPLGVARIDPHGDIVEFNQAAEKITGYASGEVLGRPHVEILHGTGDSAVCPLAAGNGSAARETPVRNKNGSMKIVALASSPLFESDMKYIGGVEYFQDVTDARRCQKERNNFLAMLAHDMRTPVVVMGGFLARLEAGKSGPVTEAQRRDLRLLIDEAARLERLVEAFLEGAKVEAEPFRPVRAPYDVLDAVTRQLRLAREEARKKQITITCSCDSALPAVVYADATLIDRVLANLLDNALKYTGAGGSILVNLSDRGNKLLVKISDTGAGIPEDELPSVFDAFHRGRWDVQGTGLGLAIVKKIIDAHGENIAVESTPGQGSRFSFTLAKR